MAEWWTVWSSYQLSDLLMFSPAAYARLFERYNVAVWPWQLPMLVAGIALMWSSRRARPAPWSWLVLAAAWAWVAWAFHWQRYAQINWAAGWFAAGFALQALLLVLAARRPAAPSSQAWPGLALLAWALFGHPLLTLVSGRSWRGIELFGVAADPTVLASLGLLLLQRPAAWWLWPIPLLWCAISGATLWTLKAPEALVLPAAALLSLALLLRFGLGTRHPASR